MCSVCGDQGYLRLDVAESDPRFGKLELCVCQMVKVSQRLQTSIGTPLDDKLNMNSVRDRGEGSRGMISAALKFLSDPHGFFTIYGLAIRDRPETSANGNGKTTCLQAIVNECIQRGYPAAYLCTSDLVDFLKAGIRDEDYDVEDRMNVLVDIPILAIDEVSQPTWTDWVQDKLTTLIDRRYRNRNGTVLALDDDPYRFLHRRIVSRLQEGVFVQNSDADMRPAMAG